MSPDEEAARVCCKIPIYNALRSLSNLRFLETDSTKKQLAIAIVLILLGVAIAYPLRFIVDDAFISFRYARNLDRGFGLVFNPGEHVEGYSNLLWTLLISIPIRLGLDASNSAIAIDLFLYPFTLLTCYLLFRRALTGFAVALAGIVVLITNYTFASFATGGLETQLDILLFVLAVVVTAKQIEQPTFMKGLLLGVISALALLNRMDSGILLLVCYAFLFLQVRNGMHAGVLFASALIPISTLVVWMLWRHNFYGYWLPNTFYVKTTGEGHLARGWQYWLAFSESYLVPFVIFLCPIAIRKSQNSLVRISGVLILLWFAYMLAIGGDWMEYRMGAVIYPFLVVVLFWFLAEIQLARLAKAAIVACLICLSFLTYMNEQTTPMIISIKDMDVNHLEWRKIGEKLHQYFGSQSSVVFAIGAVGVVPYYSDLRTVDLLGLTDLDIAKSGLRSRERRPGHEVKATIKQLIAKHVNILMPRPQILDAHHPNGEVPGSYFLYQFQADPDFSQAQRTGEYVLIPIGNDQYTIVWYLMRSAEIDRRIREDHWPVLPMEDVFYPKRLDKDLSAWGLTYNQLVG